MWLQGQGRSLGEFWGVQGSGISCRGSRVSLINHRPWGGMAVAELGSFTLPVPFLPETQNSLGPPEESPPILAQKSLPDLWSSAEAAQGTPGSLGGGHSWDRIPGQEPGTGAEAARKSVPFPPRSFCALLTASSHLPSFLPPSPSKLAPGGALTKVEPTEGAGEEGQEVRIS